MRVRNKCKDQFNSLTGVGSGTYYFFKAANVHLKNMVTSFKPGTHNYANFLTKAKSINEVIKDQGGVFSVGAVATKKDINNLYKIGKQFHEHGINFNLQVERVNGKYRKCTKEEEKKSGILAVSTVLKVPARYKGRTCFSGIRYFMLTPFGDSYRCHSACVSPDKNGYLGNLVDDSFKLYEKPKKCTFECCNCVNSYNQNLIM